MNDTGMNDTTTVPPSATNTFSSKIDVTSLVVGSVGLIGNLFVCFVFLRVRCLRTITNIFIFNQSIVDLTSSVLFLILEFGRIQVPPAGKLGDLFCKFWFSKFFMWSLFVTSTVNLLAVTLERYLAICHAVYHRNHFTKTKAKVIVVVEWLFGIPLELMWGMPFYHTGDTCAIRYISFTYNLLTGVAIFSVAWFIPLVVMLFCYIRILTKLFRMKDAAQAQPNAANGSNSAVNRVRKNVVKTLLTVSVVYAICWGPNQIALLHFNAGGHLDFTSTFYNVSVVLVFCNMCVNPFIYAFQYEMFRSSVRKAFGFAPKGRIGDSGMSEGISNTPNTHEGHSEV